VAFAWGGGPAHAQDPAVLQQVTELNKKAVEAYENLDMDEAAKFLQQALQVCAKEGLNTHKAKARTHIHLGIVMVAGLKQRERGIQQFRRALEIDPTIRPTKSLVNPEIQAAFDEAAKDMGIGAAAPEPPKPAAPAEAPKPPAAEPAAAPAAAVPEGSAPRGVKGISHTPVAEARPGTTITIKAAVEGSLGQDKIILAYRPDGATDFLARDMEKDSRGWYVARIPQPATLGSVVSYYIEARNRTGTALGSNGTAAEPHVISLSPDAPVVAAGGDEGGGTKSRRRPDHDIEDRGATAGEHKFRVSFGIGTGYGWAKGRPEVNQTDKMGRDIEFSGGFAPAQLMHLTPEVGFFMAPNLLLSLQGRLQVVTAATEVRDASCPDNKDADGVGVCAPAKGAIAILGKATWLLGKPQPFRPFFSLSAGGGEIRHLISVPLTDCGPAQNAQCTDTVLGGVILVGPGAGFSYDLSKSLSFVAGLNSLIGLPNPTVNFDLNLGLAMGL
jgi:hypothetical protein